MRQANYLFIFFLFYTSIFSQVVNDSTKVGLVLSGGGAKGIAYIGVLRVLEENEIPIDYVVGTSIGGVIGGFYAAGYSPDEMEAIIADPKTSNFISGKTQQGYHLFYNNHLKPANLFSLQFTSTKKNKLSFSPHVINASTMQLEFNKFFFKANKVSQSNFDQLFVPFRTVYSNIKKGSYEHKSHGLLANHVRATMNVPLFYPKHHIEEEVKFDGGIYNNFPVRVMNKEFNPSHIIGVQTGGHLIDESKNDDLNAGNLEYLFTKVLVNNSEYEAMQPEKDIFINPQLGDLSAFDFKKYKDLIQIGEESTRSKLDEIRKKIKRKTTQKSIAEKRKEFKNNFDFSEFNSLSITSRPSKEKQHSYLKKILQPDKNTFDFSAFEKGYHRLASSSFFDNLNPQFLYDSEKEKHHIKLEYNPENKIKLNMGGAIASQGLGFIYGGFDLQFLNKTMKEVYGDFFYGEFKKYVDAGIKHYFPTKIPLFTSLYYKGSWYDYLKSSKLDFDYQNLVFCNLKEHTPGIKLGIPFFKEGLLTLYGEIYNGRYVHSVNLFEFRYKDDIIKHRLWGPKFGLRFKKSTLNAPQHATKGTQIKFHLYRILSKHKLAINTFDESNFDYQTLNSSKTNRYAWNYAKLELEKYVHFKRLKWFDLGLELEAVYSSKKDFKSSFIAKETGDEYKINLFPLSFLTTPQFFPFWNSERFLSTFHIASSYVALGVQPIIHINKKMHLRFPTYFYNYFFDEFETEANNDTLKINPNLFSEFFVNNGIHLVYQTPFFPISIGVNRYDALVYEKVDYNFFLKIGYTLGNKMQLK